MPQLTNAQIIAKAKKDNRTVLVTPDQTNAGQHLVLTALGPEGATHGLANAITATNAANSPNIAPGDGEATVAPEGLTKDTLRTQYLFGSTYDSTKAGFGAKRCFVNLKGQPLDANGTPTTVALAVDAETTDLTALGEAVSNYAQVYRTDGTRTPVPGTYAAPSANQTALYQRYYGWTVQNDL